MYAVSIKTGKVIKEIQIEWTKMSIKLHKG